MWRWKTDFNADVFLIDWKINTDFHEWLLSDAVDILPHLLLPLAGPEELDEDDMEKLPVDLQYLEPDKKRESDPDIRKMLVECVYQVMMAVVHLLNLWKLAKWICVFVFVLACRNMYSCSYLKLTFYFWCSVL